MKKKRTADLIQIKVGANIQTVRIFRNKSVKEIAADLQLCPTAYRNLEKGISDISISKLSKLAIIFNVDFYQFYELDYSLISRKYGFDSKTQDINKQVKDLKGLHKEETDFLKKRIEFLENLLCNNNGQYPDLGKVKKLYKIDGPNR